VDGKTERSTFPPATTERFTHPPLGRGIRPEHVHSVQRFVIRRRRRVRSPVPSIRLREHSHADAAQRLLTRDLTYAWFASNADGTR